MKRVITLVLLYYNSPHMLRYQLSTIAGYPEDVGAGLHVIIVDDGSPKPAVEVVREWALWGQGRHPKSLRVFRTLVDIPWNEEFATNLGASQVLTSWFMHTDLDHTVPPETLRYLMSEVTDPGAAYRFGRVEVGLAGERRIGPHPASWFMTRDLYVTVWNDERFRGRYLPSDRDFADRLGGIVAVGDLPCDLIAHTDDIPDSAAQCSVPHGLGEDGEEIYEKIRKQRGNDGPLVLTSPWEQVWP